MNDIARRSIAIIGGGASGVILAAHLARRPSPPRIVLIERSPSIGRGLAYSTELADHRLNVEAAQMGALADDRGHFWDWYRKTHPDRGESAASYLPRGDYGRYLEHLFASAGQTTRVERVTAECVGLSTAGSVLELLLSNGSSIAAHHAVVATGHDQASRPRFPFAVSGQNIPQLHADAKVVILGTGLSMVDAWLTLAARGHRGDVIAISRRGLAPRPHAGRPDPLQLDLADIPLGTELSYFMSWYGDLLRSTLRDGGDWRRVVDGMRPFSQRIWRDWPLTAKRRFLSHLKPWWDVHRHRIAPDIHARLCEAMARGGLRIMAGKVIDGKALGDGETAVRFRPRATGVLETLDCDCVIDCTGVVRDLSRSENPLLSSLFSQGLVRSDPLGIGLDVIDTCQLVDRQGVPSKRLHALGPVTRGAFFEIEAVPDIREQASRLAESLA